MRKTLKQLQLMVECGLLTSPTDEMYFKDLLYFIKKLECEDEIIKVKLNNNGYPF